MRRRTLLFPLMLVLLGALPLVSCDSGGTTGPDPEPEPEPVYSLSSVSGRFEPPAGFALPVTDFVVSSIADADSIAADSTFTLDIPLGGSFQVLFITPAAGGDPVFLALLNPFTRGLSADLDACAQALALNNPLLIFASPQDKADYLDAVSASASYSALVAALESLYAADPLTALDYHAHPQVFQLVTETMQEAVATLEAGMAGPRAGPGPTVEDLAGAEVKVVNPRQVFYGGRVTEQGSSGSTVNTIAAAWPVAVTAWAWPPDYGTDPAETPLSLGAGSFELYFARGLDYGRFDDWADAAGRATALNTGYGLMKLAELFLGTTPYAEPGDLEGIASHLTLSQSEITRLQVAAANRDVLGYMVELCTLMQTHRTELDEWFWGLEAPAPVASYLRRLGKLMADQLQVFQILGLGDGPLPFFYDLLFAPDQISYAVSQDAGGTLSLDAQNQPPMAEFSIAPEAGIVGTEFSFDASASTDDNDTPAQLVFRWDFQSDGVWDNDWSAANYFVLFSYGTAKAYQVTLQVRDSEGLIGEQVHSVNVGGGAGTANHVKLFKNVDPWGTTSMITALTDLGFTEGQGAGTYEVLASSAMVDEPLVPGVDLVIINSDQDQTFYEHYAANQVKFTSFMYQGGAVFWEACDRGWNGGIMIDAGVILPGAVQFVDLYADYNYITNGQLPLVAGLPGTMAGGYASHGGFTNLPPGTTIYTTDGAGGTGNPTLVEYNIGEGWVIMTGQPLEYHTNNGTAGLSELLPRILAYFTGSTRTASALRVRSEAAPSRASSAHRP